MARRISAAIAAFALAACGLSAVGVYTPDGDDGGRPEGGPPPERDARTDTTIEDAGVDCGDLASDPTNCGACGRSCLGAACDGGLCEPDLLASGLGDSGAERAITVEASFVYFAFRDPGGDILRVPLDGGAAPQLVHATTQAPRARARAHERGHVLDRSGALHDVRGRQPQRRRHRRRRSSARTARRPHLPHDHQRERRSLEDLDCTWPE